MIIDLILDRKESEPLLALGHTHMVLGGIVETRYAGDEIKNGNTIIPLKCMYALCRNEFTGDVYDERILGVAVFGTYVPSLCVLVVGDYDYSSDEFTDEDMLEDSHWLDVYGDGIVTSPTLIELCNGIYDFIE